MADIFLSYAHQDLERARRLADALTSQGWSVFWDRRIPPGRTFEDYIEQRVHECRVLVVLWSPHAVDSKRVKIEAAIGRDLTKRGCWNPLEFFSVPSPLLGCSE